MVRLAGRQGVRLSVADCTLTGGESEVLLLAQPNLAAHLVIQLTCSREIGNTWSTETTVVIEPMHAYNMWKSRPRLIAYPNRMHGFFGKHARPLRMGGQKLTNGTRLNAQPKVKELT